MKAVECRALQCAREHLIPFRATEQPLRDPHSQIPKEVNSWSLFSRLPFNAGVFLYCKLALGRHRWHACRQASHLVLHSVYICNAVKVGLITVLHTQIMLYQSGISLREHSCVHHLMFWQAQHQQSMYPTAEAFNVTCITTAEQRYTCVATSTIAQERPFNACSTPGKQDRMVFL